MALTIATDAPPLVINADGVVCVAGTRVTLDMVVMAFEQSSTAEEIAQQYPALSLADVYGAITYYLHHRTDVEAYLVERQRLAAQVRQQNEARFDPTGLHSRLLARRSGKE